MKRIRTSILIVLTILLTMLPLPVGAAAAAKDAAGKHIENIAHVPESAAETVLNNPYPVSKNPTDKDIRF